MDRERKKKQLKNVDYFWGRVGQLETGAKWGRGKRKRGFLSHMKYTPAMNVLSVMQVRIGLPFISCDCPTSENGI